jgi:hypothetical protein
LGIIVGKNDLTEDGGFSVGWKRLPRDHAGDPAAAAAATYIADRLEPEKDDPLCEGLEDRNVLWK